MLWEDIPQNMASKKAKMCKAIEAQQPSKAMKNEGHESHQDHEGDRGHQGDEDHQGLRVTKATKSSS